jgi:hypothetical protein
MTTAKRNKATVVVLAQQLGAGTARHLGGSTQVPLLGSSYTPAELTTKFQQVVSLQADVDTAKAAIKDKLATQKASMATLRPLMGALVAYVKVVYGTQPGILADFGIHPKARTPLTVEAKAAAVAKRTATRAARGTKGSVQKKGIKGDVTGITVTPITAQPVAQRATSSPAVGATSPAPTAGTAPHTAT